MMTLGVNVNAQTVALDPIGLNMCRGSFDSVKEQGLEPRKKSFLVTDVSSRHPPG
jgi:hypothetical protein